MTVLTPNAVRNIQAAVVLVGAIAAWILVPGEILLPIAVIVMALAIAGIFALKAYRGRLLAAGEGSAGSEVRVILLTEVGVGLALLGLMAFLIVVLELLD